MFTNYVPLETLAINSVVGQQAGAEAEVGHENASLAAEAKGKQYQQLLTSKCGLHSNQIMPSSL